MGKKKSASDEYTDDDDALLADLGIELEEKKSQTYTPKQERIIAGFEDIQRFAREHGRPPQHGDGNDIFERLYAVRLDRILANAECLELLRPMDEDGLLSGPAGLGSNDGADHSGSPRPASGSKADEAEADETKLGISPLNPVR